MLKTKAGKIGLIALTLAPIAYLLVFFCLMTYLMFWTFQHSNQSQTASAEFTPIFFGMMIAHIAMMIVVFLLIGIYVFSIATNETLSPEMKLFWGLMILFGNMIVMPIYWYLQVWKQPKGEPHAGEARLPMS